jgi:predicted ATP-grasp superfamily ATP-dependent carboligase
MARIAVTDGDERSALAIVRSLGAAGHEVVVLSPSGRSIAGASRHAMLEEEAGDPLRDPARFLPRLRELLHRHDIEVLIPVSEASALVILDHRESLGDLTIPFPPAGTFRRVADKAAVLSTARELGIAVPTVAELASLTKAFAYADEGHVPFPVVLKPVRSVVDEDDNVRTKTRVRYADDAEGFKREAVALGSAAFPILVQRRVQGPGIGVFVLLRAGEVVAHFGHRRIREKPPSGGVSVLRESVRVPSSLLESSVELLRALDWEGVAMIEYKMDDETGTPYLMEINGRFWGSLQLAIDAGVDFPRLLVEEGEPGPDTDAPRYRTGIQSRWMWGDVDHLLARLLRSRRRLGLDASAPGRIGAVVAFFRGFLPPAREEVFRLRDPAPGIREAAQWIRDSLFGRGGEG